MDIKKSVYSVGIVIVITLVGCRRETPTPAISQVSEPTIENVRVRSANPEKRLGDTEEFPLPNCGGSGELSQSLGTQASVAKRVTVGATATTTGGAEAAIPATAKLKLELEVELAYQQAYETANSRLDTIQMTAAPGTHVVYVVQWEEQDFSSIVTYEMDGQVFEAPYNYILRVPKIGDSYPTDCLTATLTPILPPSPTPIPPSPTPILPPSPTPIPPSSPTPIPPSPTPIPPSPTPTPPSPTPTTALPPSIQGTIRYQGRPLTDFSSASPNLWMRDEQSGKSFPFEHSYNQTTGEYTIFDVPGGKYGIQVSLDTDGNGWPLPNDFYAWTTLTVAEDQGITQHNIDVLEIIHLTSPADNASVFPGPSAASYPIFRQDNVVIAWESLPKAGTYEIAIEEYQHEPSYARVATLVNTQTTDTSFVPDLPALPDNHHYELRLYAYDNGNRLGLLMINYEAGMGWDFRFRVEE